MTGFILNFNLVRNEDLIVTILTQKEILTLYRFYGARHSQINIGYKIDFEVEVSYKVTINRLRNIIQIGQNWLIDINKLKPWQQFIKILYKHLKDLGDIDSFYYELLDNMYHQINKRNAKRVIIEGYISLLKHEGRLNLNNECFVCQTKIPQNIALVRSFLKAHPKCVYDEGFEKEKVEVLFNEQKTILFDDKEIDRLFDILLLGI